MVCYSHLCLMATLLCIMSRVEFHLTSEQSVYSFVSKSPDKSHLFPIAPQLSPSGWHCREVDFFSSYSFYLVFFELTLYFLKECLEAMGMFTAQNKLHFSTNTAEQLGIGDMIHDQTRNCILIAIFLLHERQVVPYTIPNIGNTIILICVY